MTEDYKSIRKALQKHYDEKPRIPCGFSFDAQAHIEDTRIWLQIRDELEEKLLASTPEPIRIADNNYARRKAQWLARHYPEGDKHV